MPDTDTETGTYVPRLKQRYLDEVLPELKDDFGYTSRMQAPRLEKIVINKGVGDAAGNQTVLDESIEQMRKITGQQPTITRAKRSIAAFEIRKGDPVGLKTTLRGQHMWEFYDRLVTLALPNARDFTGVSDRSFDGRGNYTLGIEEQIIFPEINVDNVDRIHGMDVSFVTTAETDEEAYALLKGLGMPFVRREEQETETEEAAA